MPDSSDFHHDAVRRRLLTAMALSPLLFSLPSQAAATPPDLARIVALEWLPVELLLALGITPLAVADIHNYNLWVEEPKMPASVIDVGQRTEPNLELLQQLRLAVAAVAGIRADAAKAGPYRPDHELRLQ